MGIGQEDVRQKNELLARSFCLTSFGPLFLEKQEGREQKSSARTMEERPEHSKRATTDTPSGPSHVTLPDGWRFADNARFDRGRNSTASVSAVAFMPRDVGHVRSLACALWLGKDLGAVIIGGAEMGLLMQRLHESWRVQVWVAQVGNRMRRDNDLTIRSSG